MGNCTSSGGGGGGAGAKGSAPKLNNPAHIPSNAMTEDEYLALNGYGSPVSSYGVDKIGGANMTRMSQRQRDKTYAQITENQNEYSAKRAELKEQYKNLISRGVIRDKTKEEKIVTRAHGNPDNTSTQAARRMAEKLGIDWRTGKKLKRKS